MFWGVYFGPGVWEEDASGTGPEGTVRESSGGRDRTWSSTWRSVGDGGDGGAGLVPEGSVPGWST